MGIHKMTVEGRNASDLDREERIATLRAELEFAAGEADVHHEPLWRWLTERLDAHLPIPMHGIRPNVRLIQRLIGRRLGKTVKARAIIDAWAPRFTEALGHEIADAFPDPALAAATEITPARAAELEAIALEIETEASAAEPLDQPVYRWLAARVRADLGLPMSGARVNLTSVSERMAIGYGKVIGWGPILARWAKRTEDLAARPALRDSLPGSDATGTAVPKSILVAALEKAVDREPKDGRARLLRRLLAIAQGNRTLPRSHATVHRSLLLRQADAFDRIVRADRDEILRDWTAFFYLDERASRTHRDGSTTTKRVLSVEVQEHIDGLRDDDMTPLLASAVYPDTPSYRALERELNIAKNLAGDPSSRQIIMAYWREAGPGPVYQGRTANEKRIRNLRRDDLIAFAKKRVDAGLPLPGRLGRRPTCDFDGLVRMRGIPGPNMADDDRFKKRLRDLKPKYVRMDSLEAGEIATYRQLAAAYSKFRLASVAKGSQSATRTKVNSAIETFRVHLDKDEHHEIGADLDSPSFETTVKAVMAAGAWGPQPQNWQSEIRKARNWYQANRETDMLGDTLADVLDGAVRRDGRRMSEIIAGTGFTVGQVVNWMDGDDEPSKEAMPALPTLAENLGLARDRLSKLVGAQPISIAKMPSVKLPPAVRPFLPNDWVTRDPDEVRSMIAWIEVNLTHRNSAHGKAMRAVAAKRSETQAKAVTAKSAEDAAANETALLAAADRIAGEQMDAFLAGGGASLGKRVSAELRALRRHMVLNFPKDLRRPGIKWEPGSTAPMKIGMLTRFLRWQTLAEDDGGLGRSPEDLTLADLLHPPLMFAYIDFKAASLQHVEFEGRKRGKVFTGTEVDMLRLAKSLLDADYGFVWQRPKYVERMVADARPLPHGTFINPRGDLEDPERDLDADEFDDEAGEDGSEEVPILPAALCGLAGDAFTEAARKARLAYESAQGHVDSEAVMVRDPMEAIAPILDSPQPMTTLLRQIALASQRVPSLETNAIQHHRHVRDVLICRLLALTSLRSKNIRQITVSGPAPKLTYSERKGKWLLHINWREFKNYKSAILFGRKKRKQPYRKWIENTNGLYDLIDYYLGNSRPFFIEQGKKERRKSPIRSKGPVRELFLSATGRPLQGPGLWAAVQRFTARHVAWNPFRDEGIALCQLLRWQKV